MATLTRPQNTTRTLSSPLLNSRVPAPFPRELLEQQASTPEIQPDVHILSRPDDESSSVAPEALPSTVAIVSKVYTLSVSTADNRRRET